mgnify:CR=1 FL=1
MARINLLPWREQLREERKKEFLTILALVVLFAGALVFLADRYVNGQIENQNARNANCVEGCFQSLEVILREYMENLLKITVMRIQML